MSRRQKDPLRPLRPAEHRELERMSRSQSDPASQVARAKALLVVAEGHSYVAAAQRAGRQSGDAVSQLVSRFNHEGVRAVFPRHGGGPQRVYGPTARSQILAVARRQPARAQDGTATWSLSTLQRALRQQGLSQISTYTIWRVLKEAGVSWQKHRSWCETGTAWRKRHGTLVLVRDPDTEAKKS